MSLFEKIIWAIGIIWSVASFFNLCIVVWVDHKERKRLPINEWSSSSSNSFLMLFVVIWGPFSIGYTIQLLAKTLKGEK